MEFILIAGIVMVAYKLTRIIYKAIVAPFKRKDKKD